MGYCCRRHSRPGQPSHVIASHGLPRDVAVSVIRISIGPETTAADLSGISQAYVNVVKEMVAHSSET